ncbi:citronellol/citronellal dehydrogenase [Desulfuromusa kysingii]|uniref:Citronellol/citronellal dehydrogenase n=1 Tax=Desulfuromusa kysingii TaxID=37625 RepID=A0A1H4D4T4_9BACT|nr:NAD(P)-dependent oxidoreductase [Desulfuromusa kysingii]SEA67765.1 citronellol/citronellal dehydrogenase [Desulfuromusa kysingii]
MNDLAGKTLFITGASRGIGLAVALKAASQGANIVIAAKTSSPHPKLPGTIFTAAEEVEKAGGKALPLVVDIREESQLSAAATTAAETFGGIDILINNASAIFLSGTLNTPMKRFDLMNQVNVRGTFLASQVCLPHLLKSDNPHILTFSPPLNLNPRWFKNHTAYTMAKYGMSMTVLGLSAEFSEQGVAVNALWPKTVINTAALAMLGGLVDPQKCRTPEIMADAACAILCRDSRTCSGNFFIDEDVLRGQGVTDFSPYAVADGNQLYPDLFLD